MSTRKKPNNFVQRLIRAIWRFFNATTKAVINWLLRSLLGRQRRRRPSQAGFVLPTVVMVILVITLLTSAILFRSFDRSKNASNYRVNEVVLNAATPALDRSRAKLRRLFSTEETNLKGNTPPDDNIAEVLENPRYTFGDETPLKLVADLDGNGVGDDEQNEKLQSAWKFPIDTDNNGKFDSFTLYGIYFRVPDEERARAPLEARARPQITGKIDPCAAGNAGGGGDAGSGWYSISGQLKKAFFTYVATVPITPDQFGELQTAGYKDGSIAGDKFEAYVGNRGFSALEVQQDQARLALDNNAVWYEDDLILTDVPNQGGFKLNGRIQVNGNLMLGSNFGAITFYQVSSPYSCFYNAENGKIVVGGNVSANGIAGNVDTQDLTNANVQVHLFKEPNQDFDPGAAGNSFLVNNGNVTTENPPRSVAGNTSAYAKRLNVLVQGGMKVYDDANAGAAPAPGNVTGLYPAEISELFEIKYPNDQAVSPEEARNLLEQVITVYFKERIRKVPFVEVGIDAAPEDATTGVDTNDVFGAGVPEAWMKIDAVDLTLKPNELEQTDPAELNNDGVEEEIGDRILAGNGLPIRWLQDDGDFAEVGEEQDTDGDWTPSTGGGNRTRQSRVKILDDLGNTSRNGFWEKAAADPENIPGDEELAGGLRVITGAGIYIDGLAPPSGGTGKRIGEAARGLGRFLGYERSFLPEPPITPTQLQSLNAEIDPTTTPVTVVWPDTMPMYQWNDNNDGVYGRNEVFKGDLQMRATVVYHYTDGDNPIACISSYYDPTNTTTAKNSSTVDTANGDPLGVSNNGISYQLPAVSRTATATLRRQAYMVFPDGRWVNKPLKDAIEALLAGNDLSLEQKAAIDSANCALAILNEEVSPSAGVIPDNAIRERAFLDARQVKTIHKPDVEFSADGINSDPDLPIARATTLTDTAGKVLIADPEQLKIATQATLYSPLSPKDPAPAEYSLPLEERQPLEVRVTEIDLEQLRTTEHGTTATGKTEYLLPLSGIIYASRDDALPDITDVNIRGDFSDGGSSATDFKLDPSRRPNGIRLWSSGNNGGRLSRGTTNEDDSDEKGLTLASNLPVYIKGDFNRHYEFGSNTPTEEFTEVLANNYGNFYDRGDGGAADVNDNFACREGSRDGCDPGDQWRAARVLSDAITLLSNNFRDGFREEGNYDFNNNAGNLAVASRLKNGFWWNGFATNYLYQDAAGTTQTYPIDADFLEQDDVNPVAEIEGSSYAMNGVTPIQRRVNFPEYQMEICAKVPVSECGPQDWVQTGAGTTAAPTAAAGDDLRDLAPEYTLRDYPRRVVFQRDSSDFGQLTLDVTGAAPTAIPVGASGGSSAAPINYAAGASAPDSADNALWFWTTNSNANPSAFDPASSYNSDNLLYYLPDDPEVGVDTERQMLLPGTPAFPPELEALDTAFAGQSQLNGTGETDPSDYSVCIAAEASNEYKLTSFNGPACPTAVRNRITRMWRALYTRLAATTDSLDTNLAKVTVRPYEPDPTGTVIEADAKVNAIDLQSSSGNQLTGEITLSRGEQLDPIFVIRGFPNRPMDFEGVTLKLDGVDPNNVFWVSRGNMRIRNTDGIPTVKLAGNFIGGPTGRLVINDAASVVGGRFLGFGSTSSGGSSITAGSGEITALTTTAQPLLVPVLQLHSPEGAPSTVLNNAFVSSSRTPEDRKWLQRATSTDYNAVLVMGDTPARPFTSGGGENNGGLHNFPRFIENWSGGANPIQATIKGSLIQYIKSKYATGPYDAIDLIGQDNSLFFDGATPDYITGSNPVVPNGYQYTEAAGAGAGAKSPYYQPPSRAWGYDVGLLSQTPDLFSRRIALPEAGDPNEFYREVGRDDAWVQRLLCAAQKEGGNYKWALADEQQRPAACRTGNPGAEYNDPA